MVGRDRSRGGRKGDKRHPSGGFGPVNENVDRRMTRNDDGRTEKKYKNQLYCHTHGYKCIDKNNSGHCMYPEKDTNPVLQRQIQWDVVYYTNDSRIVHGCVG